MALNKIDVTDASNDRFLSLSNGKFKSLSSALKFEASVLDAFESIRLPSLFDSKEVFLSTLDNLFKKKAGSKTRAIWKNNGIWFVGIKDSTSSVKPHFTHIFTPIIRTLSERFSTTVIRNSDNLFFATNASFYSSPYYSEETAPTNNVQGFVFKNGVQVLGRSSPLQTYVRLRRKTGEQDLMSIGKTDPPQDGTTFNAFSGLRPLALSLPTHKDENNNIDGVLRYGSQNIAQDGSVLPIQPIPTTAQEDTLRLRYQTYWDSLENDWIFNPAPPPLNIPEKLPHNWGAGFLGFNFIMHQVVSLVPADSQSALTIVIIQPHRPAPRDFNTIRDQMVRKGFKDIVSFDNSDSAFLYDFDLNNSGGWRYPAKVGDLEQDKDFTNVVGYGFTK